jgi:rRNA maturation endonuclease Nob1
MSQLDAMPLDERGQEIRPIDLEAEQAQCPACSQEFNPSAQKCCPGCGLRFG